MINEEPQTLNEWQRDAVYFIERHHSIAGAVPKDDDIIEYLKWTKGHQGINTETIEVLKANPLFRASMESRGIVCNYGEGPLWQVDDLTQRQMAAAAIMLNLKDRRSDEKKLRDIGVSTDEFTSWMQNATFAEYMRQRSEVMISNATHEAHMGLMRGVVQGNTASIKLYYEMTGRYNPNEENNVNIRLVIGQVLEAIQKHVRDPNVLNAIAVDMSQIALTAGTTPPVANSYTSGATRKEINNG
jgi:hypothetical protein